MKSHHEFSNLFCRPGGGNPYRANAYSVLGLEPGQLLLHQIVAAAQQREVNIRYQPEGNLVDGKPLDRETISAARAVLENPNRRIAEGLLRHRFHGRLRTAVELLAQSTPAAAFVEPAVELLFPRVLAEFEMPPHALEQELRRAPDSNDKIMLLEIIASTAPSAGLDRELEFRRALLRLRSPVQPPLRAASLCLRGRIEASTHRIDKATATVDELETSATSSAERQIASSLRLALYKMSSLGRLPPALESICRLVRQERIKQVVSLLQTFLRREPQHARAQVLLGACALRCGYVVIALDALRKACDAAEMNRDSECMRSIRAVIRPFLSRGTRGV